MLPLSSAAILSLLATGGTTTNSNNNSPWSPSEWIINMNIGRELSTGSSILPENWGTSGARLCLQIPILIESDRTASNVVDDGFLGAKKSYQLHVLEDPTFIGMKGEQTVKFEDTGAWKISLSSRCGVGNKLRFYLDVSSNNNNDDNNNNIAAQRNDVTLFHNERLYFISNCWRKDNNNKELELGITEFQKIKSRLDVAQSRVESQLSHETGDRRLDGNNAFDTTLANIDMSFLIRERDDALNAYRDAEKMLPNKLSIAGPWPGTTDPLVIGEPGMILISNKNNNQRNKKKGGGLLSWYAAATGVEEFDVIGTWTATPQPDGDYEYYDDEEEEQTKQQQQQQSEVWE